MLEGHQASLVLSHHAPGHDQAIGTSRDEVPLVKEQALYGSLVSRESLQEKTPLLSDPLRPDCHSSADQSWRLLWLNPNAILHSSVRVPRLACPSTDLTSLGRPERPMPPCWQRAPSPLGKNVTKLSSCCDGSWLERVPSPRSREPSSPSSLLSS